MIKHVGRYLGCISYLLLSGLVIQPAHSAEDIVVRHITHNTDEDFRDSYYAELLKLSLQKTRQQYGGFNLQPIPLGVFQGRIIEILKKGQQLDVIWTMTSDEREQQLLPIRIPLAKGIMGYRLLMIAKGQQHKFTDITDKQLQQLWAGQAFDWPDAKILHANQFTVMTAPPDRLLAMLKLGRFDYFPRGLQEAWDEVDQYEGVEIENSLLLYYPAPMFFFVNNNNPALAQRIEEGLRLAIQSGEHDQLLEKFNFINQAVERANIQNRRVITLENPSLTAESQAALIGFQLHAQTDR